MQESKKKFNKCWAWLIVLIITSGILITGLKYIGMIGHTTMERVIFTNSYQKTAADNTAINTYRAQLAAVEYKLQHGTLDTNIRQNLEAQEAMLKVQINTLTRN